MFRLAKLTDMPRILEIYANARIFMKNSGNPTQWNNGHPREEILLQDIEKKRLYVYETDKIHGVFMFVYENDPTYDYIEGKWMDDSSYGVMHRVASSGEIKRLLDQMISYCWDVVPHLRIDTHEDNWVMKNALLRNGFKECGIIYLENGDPRVAYEKIE